MGQVCGRIPLLSVDEMRELGRISQEKHRCVVCNNIPVALVSTKFDAEATGISGTIVRATLRHISLNILSDLFVYAE